MLYVFQVDTGVMMTFEMRLAMDTVANLKKAIAIKTDTPEDKQVLLISGGESLSGVQRVCSYSSAGTDTSPIFLFSKLNIESNQPPIPNVIPGDDADMIEMIESCMSMQPSLDTLVARTELAADLNEQGTKQKEICERLVHDQHLQQQGWAAVTANFEDLTSAFKSKAEMLMVAFGEFTKCKPSHRELLNKFSDDIKHLDNIPILPSLIENNKVNSPVSSTTVSLSGAGTSDQKKNEPESAQMSSSQPPPSNISDESPLITLRQWIDDHDSHNSLERLIELCWRGLDRFTESNAEQIGLEVQKLLNEINEINNTSMKEKKLEQRLFDLDKLMVDAKKVVDEQSQLAASFQSNRERFSKIKDLSLLPDLSASHKQQLQMMLANHKLMNDYRNRCIKAKYELSARLHDKLRRIMLIEQKISYLDNKLMIYKENLLRLDRHFEIVHQVHRSPNLYLEAVVESLRRRHFSRRYLHWASSIAKISNELYENEMSTRKAFDAKLNSHFLSNLFPGLTKSYPPQFATVQPDPFDTKLPRITAADIQYLQANLSDELAGKLHIPKDIPMPHIINAPNTFDEGLREDSDSLDRHSLNPTPPSSPTRQQDDD